MKWSESESALKHARAALAEGYPGEAIEIVETFDIAYVGWECDFQGALITRDGLPELVVVDDTGGDSRPVSVRLQQRMDEYRRLIDDIERVRQRQIELLLAYVKAGLDKADRPPKPEEVGRRFDDAVKAIAPYFGSAEADAGAIEVLRGITDDEMPDNVAAAIEQRVRVLDDGMPDHMIARFERLADTPYDVATVDAAAQVYAAAVQAAGGAYGHALAAVWRAWHRQVSGE